MNNNLTNKNQLTIEQWFTNKNQGNNINDKEIQRFKSNVLAIKNQLGLVNANLNTILEAYYQATLLNLPLEKTLVIVELFHLKEKHNFKWVIKVIFN